MGPKALTEAEWLSATESQTLLRHLRATGGISHRQARHFACVCVRRVWHLLPDERSKRGIEVREKYEDGLATEEEMDTAIEAAGQAEDEASRMYRVLHPGAVRGPAQAPVLAAAAAWVAASGGSVRTLVLVNDAVVCERRGTQGGTITMRERARRACSGTSSATRSHSYGLRPSGPRQLPASLKASTVATMSPSPSPTLSVSAGLSSSRLTSVRGIIPRVVNGWMRSWARVESAEPMRRWGVCRRRRVHRRRKCAKGTGRVDVGDRQSPRPHAETPAGRLGSAISCSPYSTVPRYS